MYPSIVIAPVAFTSSIGTPVISDTAKRVPVRSSVIEKSCP